VARLNTLPRHGATASEPRYSRLVYLDAPWAAADAYTTHVHMQQEHTSAPKIVDLDPDGHNLSTSVLLTAQSVANLPLTSFPSPLANAPLLTQKCASNRAQPPSPTFNLSPKTDPTFLSPNPTVSTASSSSTPHQLHAPSNRVPDSATDSVHKGLRPKASYHQSLLNLRDELFRPSDSGAYRFRAPSYTDYHYCFPGRHIHQPVSHARLIWRLLRNSTLLI
jgi:hypothetical protein